MIFDEVKEILAEQLDIDPETIEMTSNLLFRIDPQLT